MFPYRSGISNTPFRIFSGYLVPGTCTSSTNETFEVKDLTAIDYDSVMVAGVRVFF